MKYTNRITKKLELMLDSDFDISIMEVNEDNECEYFTANVKYKKVNTVLNLRVHNDYCEVDIGGEWSTVDRIAIVMFKLLADSINE